jgi:hypothetical protein
MEKEIFMKKLGFAALLVAGVIAAAGVFAQEIKFDGYVNSGIGILSTDAKVQDGDGTKTADTKVVAFGVDSEQSIYRFRLNGSYASEDGNTGAKFRFQAQNNFNSGAFSIPYAYGWASFFNKILTVNGGLVDDGAWGSGGAILNDDVGEGLGTLVKASPIDGLNLGVGVYVITPQGGGSNNTIIVPDEVSLGRLKYTFNAGYAVPDLLKLTLTFRTANQTGDATGKYNDADTERFAGSETSKLIFGAQVLAVKGLTAVVEVEADKLEDTGVDKEKDNIDLNLYETLGYKLGDLAFGLNAVQYIRVEKDVDHDFGLQLNPWVSYAIGSIVPRLDLTYFLAGTATTTLASVTDDGQGNIIFNPAALGSKYHREVFAYKDTGSDVDDVSVIGIRPSVKFNVGKSFIEIGDLIAYGWGFEGAFADAGDIEKSSSFNNVFYIDFKWSF